MEEIINMPELPADVQVVDIQFRPGQKIYYFDPNGIDCKTGDHVIIDTARGPEFGTCVAAAHTIPSKDVVAPLRPVLRLATAHDEKVAAENQAKGKKAYEVCLQKIAEHNLDMQLVSAECAFDGSKLLFFFTADERVDFRELVKNLASVFHTRIELRQIGVRDKAKMVGGLGICGRPFCCASFLDDFQPVSIKMAKTQNLSLNPTKISGTCGRLMCCLKYEQDTYESLIRSSPKPESFVDTPEGRGTVVEVDILRQRVKVQMENDPETVHPFPNEEIAILRNGKARKNDPPIPADLAPISGEGKRPARAKPEEAPILEPIRFRYSTESIVEEAPASQPAPEQPEEPRQRRQRRRRGSRPGADQGPRPETQPEQAKPEQAGSEERPARQRQRRPQQPKGDKPEDREQPENRRPPKKQPQGAAQPDAPQTEGAPEAKKPRSRNNHYRHRKPKAPQA